MATRMLIDARHPEETRVAVLKGNRIEEFDFESAEHKQIKGNIYLAKVTRVEPSLQAAFVDFGGNHVAQVTGGADRHRDEAHLQHPTSCSPAPGHQSRPAHGSLPLAPRTCPDITDALETNASALLSMCCTEVTHRDAPKSNSGMPAGKNRRQGVAKDDIFSLSRSLSS